MRGKQIKPIDTYLKHSQNILINRMFILLSGSANFSQLQKCKTTFKTNLTFILSFKVLPFPVFLHCNAFLTYIFL